jgi:hypothetical protein
VQGNDPEVPPIVAGLANGDTITGWGWNNSGNTDIFRVRLTSPAGLGPVRTASAKPGVERGAVAPALDIASGGNAALAVWGQPVQRGPDLATVELRPISKTGTLGPSQTIATQHNSVYGFTLVQGAMDTAKQAVVVFQGTHGLYVTGGPG